MLYIQMSSSVLAGQAEGAEVPWRKLYACSNGWRGLRQGCFEELMLPVSTHPRLHFCGGSPPSYQYGYPPHCIVDGGDLGWTAATGDASELLAFVDQTSVRVTLCACSPFQCLHCMHLPTELLLPADVQLQLEPAAAGVQLRQKILCRFQSHCRSASGAQSCCELHWHRRARLGNGRL